MNKCLPGKNPARDLCLGMGVDILGEIPFDRETGRMISEGEVAVFKNPYLRAVFSNILMRIKKEIHS